MMFVLVYISVLNQNGIKDTFIDVKSLFLVLPPCWKTIEKVIDLMVIMGTVLVLMKTIMVFIGMWWVLLVGC